MTLSCVTLQVWQIALKPDSNLLSPQTISKLPTDEATAVAQLCRLLLLKHPHELDQDTIATVCRLLLALLLHYAAPVRQAAKDAAGQCLTHKTSLAGQCDGGTLSCTCSGCSYPLWMCCVWLILVAYVNSTLAAVLQFLALRVH